MAGTLELLIVVTSVCQEILQGPQLFQICCHLEGGGIDRLLGDCRFRIRHGHGDRHGLRRFLWSCLLLDSFLHGLRGCFDAVCGSDPGLNNNAKWEVVLRAMQACGAAPETTVLVGDTKYDAIGAAKAGIPCIGAAWGYAAPRELEEAGVLCTARDFAELEALLLAEQHTK